ncbi:hypothetical protein L6164_019497 [Bauhinia variegata]|uniref:Uncharacterized protein n=1 Tax=Bauhinia variegata TaxID=167791 RepID=A0ACB9MTA8_BAUVA|nr:hypothetical protein L6164_019497 [Bauhinia variegata]
MLVSSRITSISPKMTIIKSLSNMTFLAIALCLSSAITQAARFNVTNTCPFTVWAAAVPGGPSGGKQLNSGESWAIDVAAGSQNARIWARTGCSFDESGRGRCDTGDCGGLLECQEHGTPPNTLAEYSLDQLNSSNSDFFYISLMEGFNVKMEFSPTSDGCPRGITCNADIIQQCPSELRTQGGCNNPCTAFKTDKYCCNSGSCRPTGYSNFFKNKCPDAFTYPKDDSLFMNCPGGTNYKVVFCP